MNNWGVRTAAVFRYDLLNVVSLSANSNTQSTDNSVPATNFIIGWNHVFTPKLMMDNRYGQTRRPFARATSDSAGLSPMTGLGFASPGGTLLTLSSPWGSGGVNLANTIVSPVRDLSDNLTWLHGQHNIKFGLQYINQGNASTSPPYGSFNFTNDTTGNPESVGNTGNSVASAFLGLPSAASNASSFTHTNHFSTWAGYGQDSWNVSKDVTVTYGFRLDHRRPFAPDSTTFVSEPQY